VDTLERFVIGLDVTAFWQGRDERFDHAALVTDADGNRWNAPGEPAIYLAGDMGLALVEAGRHEPGSEPGDRVEGIVWSLEVAVGSVLDLRQDDVRAELGLDAPHWFLDRGRCRSLAADLRAGEVCAGIVTQSAGLPDDPDRWNLVLFADRLRRPLTEVIRRPRRIGSFRLGATEAPVGAPSAFAFDAGDG
jgi:hypothetical protein